METQSISKNHILPVEGIYRSSPDRRTNQNSIVNLRNGYLLVVHNVWQLLYLRILNSITWRPVFGEGYAEMCCSGYRKNFIQSAASSFITSSSLTWLKDW